MSNKLNDPDISEISFIKESFLQMQRAKQSIYFNCYCKVQTCCPTCKSENIVHLIDPRFLYHSWKCLDCQEIFESKYDRKIKRQIKCRCQIQRECPTCKSNNIRHVIKPLSYNFIHGWKCLDCQQVWNHESDIESYEIPFSVTCPYCNKSIKVRDKELKETIRIYCPYCRKTHYLQEVKG